MAFLALVSEGVLTDGEHSQANWPLSISWLYSFPSRLFITPPTGWPWRTEMSSHCPVQYPPFSQAYPVLSTKDHRIAAACSSGESLPLLLTLCCDVSRTHLVMWLPCWKLCRALHYVQNKIHILSFLFRPWRNRAGVQFLFLSVPPWTPRHQQAGMTGNEQSWIPETIGLPDQDQREWDSRSYVFGSVWWLGRKRSNGEAVVCDPVCFPCVFLECIKYRSCV